MVQIPGRSSSAGCCTRPVSCSCRWSSPRSSRVTPPRHSKSAHCVCTAHWRLICCSGAHPEADLLFRGAGGGGRLGLAPRQGIGPAGAGRRQVVEWRKGSGRCRGGGGGGEGEVGSRCWDGPAAADAFGSNMFSGFLEAVNPFGYILHHSPCSKR